MIEQLWYTWSPVGIDSLRGFRIRATSKGLMDSNSERVRTLSRYLGYSLPPGTDSYTVDLNAAPVSLALINTSRERILVNKVYLKHNGAGGRNNFFAHLLAELPADFSAPDAIALWKSPFWVRSDTSLSQAQFALPLVTRHDLRTGPEFDFVEVKDALPFVIQAYLALLGTQKKLYIFAPADQVAALIAGLVSCLPKTWINNLTFSTYEADITRTSAQIVGTCLPPTTNSKQDPFAVYLQGTNLAINCYTGNHSSLEENADAEFFAAHATQYLVTGNRNKLTRLLARIEPVENVDVKTFLTNAKQEIVGEEDTINFDSALSNSSVPSVESVHKQQITDLLAQSVLAAKSLAHPSVQHAILDLVIGDDLWWKNTGRELLSTLSLEAEKQSNLEMRENITNALAGLATKVIDQTGDAIKQQDEPNFLRLLELLFCLVPTGPISSRFSGYIKLYLHTFSFSDLERSSAREILQLIQDMFSSRLVPELRTRVQNWLTVWASIEQLKMTKKALTALASAISSLPTETHMQFLEKLGVSCVPLVECELDLMCVLHTMATVFTQSQVLQLFLYMAEMAGEEYKRTQKEGQLVPYIRMALQYDLLYELSAVEQEQVVTPLLKRLLQNIDNKAFSILDKLVQSWPARYGPVWATQVSKWKSSV